MSDRLEPRVRRITGLVAVAIVTVAAWAAAAPVPRSTTNLQEPPRKMAQQKKQDPVTKKSSVPIVLIADGLLCYHNNSSDWFCPDSIPPIEWNQVLEVRVQIIQKDKTILTHVLPSNSDAVFFTRDATNRFMIPYYNGKDPAKAAMLSTRIKK